MIEQREPIMFSVCKLRTNTTISLGDTGHKLGVPYWMSLDFVLMTLFKVPKTP